MFLTLYYGSEDKINDFSISDLKKDKSHNNQGYGFYFFDNLEEARNNGKYVYQCKVRIGDKINVDYVGTLKRQKLETIIKNSPDFKKNLKEFGDVDREGFFSVLQKAIDAYHVRDKLSKKIFEICNDFYNGFEYRFFQSLYRVTGINCIYEEKNGRTTYNIFFPNQIKILNLLD